MRRGARRWSFTGSTPCRRQSRRSKRVLLSRPQVETPSWDSLLSCGPTGTPTGELAGYVARWDKPDVGKAINLPELSPNPPKGCSHVGQTKDERQEKETVRP